MFWLHNLSLKAIACDDANQFISSQSKHVQHNLAKFTEKFRKYKQKASVQIENCEKKPSFDIDICSKGLRQQFQLKKSKFESIKDMKRKHIEHCNERFNTPSLKSASNSAYVYASVSKKNSVSSHQPVKAKSRKSGKELSAQNNNSIMKLVHSTKQQTSNITNNASSCNYYYAKKFCSLSLKNSV